MKKTLKQKIVKESIGRDLIGAGRFESRKSVVEKILKKYPTPQSLAAGLNKLAGKLEGKAQAKVAEVATKCAACDAASYPVFVKKLAGLSKLWKYLATSAAAATIAAGATWIVKSYIDAGNELDLEKNGPIGSTQARLNPKEISFGDQAERTVRNMTQDVADVARKVKSATPQSIKNLVSKDTKDFIRNSKLVKDLKDPTKAAAKVRDYSYDTLENIKNWWNNKQANDALGSKTLASMM